MKSCSMSLRRLKIVRRTGYAAAYFNLGGPYAQGTGVGAKYYCELAAAMGKVKARYNLGCIEEGAGNASLRL